MNLCINKIISGIILFFIFFFNVVDVKSQTGVLNKKVEIEQSFVSGKLLKTLDLLFILAHHYNTCYDSVNLCKTWSEISIINKLLDKKYQAKAALKIAKGYSKTPNNRYLLLGDAFDKIDEKTNVIPNFVQSKDLKDTFFIRLAYLLRYKIISKNNDTSNPIKGHNLYEIALNSLIEELSGREDTLWFGYRNILFEKGSFCSQKYDYRSSLVYYKRVIAISEKIEDVSTECISAFSALFRICKAIRDNDEALLYFNKMVQLYNNKSIPKSLYGEYFKVKGVYYYLKTEYLECINAVKLSADLDNTISQKSVFLIEAYFYLGDYNNVINLHLKYKGERGAYYYLLVAYSYLKIGNVELAKIYGQKINNQELLNAKRKEALSFSLMADLNSGIGNFKRAEYYLSLYLAETIKRYTEHSIQTSHAYSALAYFQWTINGDIEKALQYYQKELCLLIKEPYQADLFLLPDISKSNSDEALATCLRNKGEAFLELAKLANDRHLKIKYLEVCLANFELAFKALNKYKFALLSEEKKLVYSNLTRHYYSYVIEASYQLYSITNEKKYANKVFEYIEKSKASVLLSMIKGSGAKKLNMVPPEITKTEDYIREHTDIYTKRIADENNKVSPNIAKIDECNFLLNGLRKQQDGLLSEIKIKYPSYYNLKYGAEVAGVNELQKKLAVNQAAVQYALSHTSIYIFWVSKGDFKIFKKPIDPSFAKNIEKYRKAISGFSYSDTKDTAIYAYAALTYKLYQTLIGPFADLVAGKELIIIPDDILNSIPFEALVTQNISKVKDISYRNLPYLINKNSIVYNYSASLLVQSAGALKSNGQSTKLLAMAPVYSQFTMSDINKVEATRDLNEIVPIPGTIDEVKAIHKIFKGKLLLGKSATEAKFKDISQQYDIIHIASHGFVNNEHPLYSKLVFNASDRDSVNDGLLNTYEIYNMHVSAPLVVLSACNTGYGKLYMGEGTISLARGFYAAGAQNIIMTLWAITDKTSNKLVQQFYTNLAKSETVPVSLQQAKLKFIRDADEISTHPFFWAGYITVGEPEIRFYNIKHNRTCKLIFVGIGVVVMFSLVYILRRKYLKRRA